METTPPLPTAPGQAVRGTTAVSAADTATPPPPPPGDRPARPGRARSRRARFGARLTRSRTDRVVAGVAGGLSRRLQVDPVLIRMAFAVLAFAGGAGVLLYGLLWLRAPQEPEDAPPAPPPQTSVQQSVALGLIVLGVLFGLRNLGLWFGDGIVLPIVLATVGSAVVWARGDEEDRTRWSAAAARLPTGAARIVTDTTTSPLRIAVGIVLVAGAAAGFVAANDALNAVRDLVLAAVAALAGAILLFGPWLQGLIQQLRTERRERIRQEQRAEMAAHLHDSVLQTLALIQRSADEPRRMVALARRQERELRGWLYGPPATGDAASLGDAARRVAEEVESVHLVAVELVVVGDAPVDDAVRALLGALQEACVNAAKHADVDTVDAYVEVEDGEVVAFVRDRGAGFDPETVPDDRHGIRHSIVARLERHQGRATVRSSPGSGTEVELRVPLGGTPTTEPAAPAGTATEEEAPT